MKKMTGILACIALIFSLAGIHGVSAVGRIIPFARTAHILGRDGLCLAVMGQYPADHLPAQLTSCEPQPDGLQSNQLWTFLVDGTIMSMGKCLVPHTNSAGDYAMIDDCEKSTEDAKRWTLSPDGTLTHVHSRLVLTAKSTEQHSMPTLEHNVYAATQGWEASNNLKPAVAQVQGLDNLCLRAQSDNQHVWMDSCNREKDRLLWEIYPDGTIRPKFDSGLCCTSTGTSAVDPVNLSKCVGSIEQRWHRRDDSTIENLNSKLVMDVRGNDPAARQVILYQRTGRDNQKWTYIYPN